MRSTWSKWSKPGCPWCDVGLPVVHTCENFPWQLSFLRQAFLSDYLTDLYTGKGKKKILKNCPQWGLKPGPLDHKANALPTELSQHSVARLNLPGLYKVMLYLLILEMNKVQHVKWYMKQTKLTSEISCPKDLLPSSVGRALVPWCRGPGFNPHWGQFLTNFFCPSLCKNLSDNLTETPIVKNSNQPERKKFRLDRERTPHDLPQISDKLIHSTFSLFSS